jgi:hypothetical protein
MNIEWENFVSVLEVGDCLVVIFWGLEKFIQIRVVMGNQNQKLKIQVSQFPD